MKTENNIDLPNPPQGYKWEFDATSDYGYGCSLKAVRIAQPTTLADLVGEDGQKNFYVIQGDDSIFQGEVDTILGTLEVNSYELTHHVNKGSRWSHSPFTSWVDGNEFVPE